jgi:hypothetical protein
MLWGSGEIDYFFEEVRKGLAKKWVGRWRGFQEALTQCLQARGHVLFYFTHTHTHTPSPRLSVLCKSNLMKPTNQDRERRSSKEKAVYCQ